MDEIRKISVSELINMFVAISYLQEQRFFNFGDIYKYIEKCYEYDDLEYREEVSLSDLINEAELAIEQMLNDGIISYVYTNGDTGMYFVNNQIDFIDIAKNDKEYLNDMKKVFLNIHGGKLMRVTFTNQELKQKK